MKTISYRGVRMTPGWPERITASQSQRHYTSRGVSYARVPYGSEAPGWGDRPCRDCGVVKGELHVFAECEYEACPLCGATQVGSCDCDFDEFSDARGPNPTRSTLGDRILIGILLAAILLCIFATLIAARGFL